MGQSSKLYGPYWSNITCVNTIINPHMCKTLDCGFVFSIVQSHTMRFYLNRDTLPGSTGLRQVGRTGLRQDRAEAGRQDRAEAGRQDQAEAGQG